MFIFFDSYSFSPHIRSNLSPIIQDRGVAAEEVATMVDSRVVNFHRDKSIQFKKSTPHKRLHMQLNRQQ